MGLELETLRDNDLKKLSKSDVREILEYEFNTEKDKNNIYFEAERIIKHPDHKTTLLRILELFLTYDGGHSVGKVEDYHRSKPPLEILHQLQQESDILEKTFFYYIRVLYSQKLLTYFKEYEFLDNPLLPYENYVLGDVPTLIPDKTSRWRYNFEWLYQNHKDAFELPFPSIEMNSHYKAESVYDSCLEYGSIFELAIHSNLKLTDKGMHYIQSLTNENMNKSLNKTYELNKKLKEEITKQEEIIKKQEESIEKHEGNIERQEETVKKHESLTTSLNEQIEKQKKEVSAFYQHIVSILSLLVAAFCFIGINISALPKIEENFAENVIIINLSIILVTTVIFWIIKSLLFESDANKKQQKLWYVIFFVTITLLVAVYGWLGPNVEKNNLNKYKKEIEGKYDQKMENLKHDIEKSNLQIENLSKKIEQLEKQNKSSQQ